MKSLVTATTLALVAASSAAWAGPAYVSLKAGGTQLQDADFETTSGQVHTETDTGYIGTAAIGTHLNQNARVEFEVGYSKSDLDSASVAGAPASAEGDVTDLTGMINGYYDFAPNCLIRPYVGVGLGAAHVSYNNARVGGAAFTDDSDTVAAGQAMAGVKWQFTPKTAATLEYRYLKTGDVELDGAAGGTTKADHSSHSVLAGLQFDF